MKIRDLIAVLTEKEKEGFKEVNVCIDGMTEYHICGLELSECETSDGKTLPYISFMVATDDEW